MVQTDNEYMQLSKEATLENLNLTNTDIWANINTILAKSCSTLLLFDITRVQLF